MSDRILADREKALEELFFEKQNRKLVEKLRTEREHTEAKAGLQALTGIQDESLLQTLVSLDLGPETWAAVSLLPLVEVAWADGGVEEKERRAILTAAEANGITKGSASWGLLERWLETRPDSGYLEAWGASMVELCSRLDPSERAAMKREILDRATRVAESAGGFLGLGSKLSAQEQRILDELAKAFE